MWAHTHASAWIVLRRVSTKQSPHFKAFCRQRPLTITLVTGLETSIIKATVARSLDITIDKSSQQALQADERTSYDFTTSHAPNLYGLKTTTIRRCFYKITKLSPLHTCPNKPLVLPNQTTWIRVHDHSVIKNYISILTCVNVTHRRCK